MLPSEFAKDVETVAAAIDSDGPLTDEQRAAAKRIFTNLLFAWVTVPISLEQIAAAQTALSQASAALVNRPPAAPV